MKSLIKFAALAILLSTLFGCATGGDQYETRLDPPAGAFNTMFMRYSQLPGEKVLVVAVDPGGRWAYGYDHSQDSLEDAAKHAAIKCDAARKEHKVFSKAHIYAINEDVIYKNAMD